MDTEQIDNEENFQNYIKGRGRKLIYYLFRSYILNSSTNYVIKHIQTNVQFFFYFNWYWVIQGEKDIWPI